MPTPQKKEEAITDEFAQILTVQAGRQLMTSRQFKRARMTEIQENEDLYHGIIQKSIRNPFNECFPFMSGYVDYLRSKIDDDSTLLFTYQAETDLKRAQKINGFYELESQSIASNALWDMKHRHAKYNAIFSGVAIYSYYAEKTPDYRSCLEVISHYDFHCEPRGGAILENHLFCGQDNLFKNNEDILGNDYYNQEQVKKLVAAYSQADFKENDDQDNIRNNRLQALKQDAVTNNYVGQGVVKLVQWYTTYKGKRYYILFNETTATWIRVCKIEDMFPDSLYPYLAWHTNEDGDVFWSKAPADDARPIAKIINTMINQELYNRQKINYGETHYDAEMYPNVQALIDSRPDKFVPVDTKGGQRSLSSGIYKVQVGAIAGTLELVTWLDQFTGKNMGKTAAAAGVSENNKKVGVFQGEIEQVDQLINVKNKSFRTCLSQLGYRFKQGLDHNLTTEKAVKIMGAKGVEWTTLTKEDLKTDQDLKIQPIGGTSEIALKRAKDNEKMMTLGALQTVNPQWKERQMLLTKGFTEEDVKDAFSPETFAQKELLSEAAIAEKEIVEGGMPKLNRGADSNFMQHIVDFAVNTDDLSPEVYKKLMDYAMAHTDIAVENETRNIKDMIRQKKMQAFAQAPLETPTGKAPGGAIKSPIQPAPVDNSSAAMPLI